VLGIQVKALLEVHSISYVLKKSWRDDFQWLANEL